MERIYWLVCNSIVHSALFDYAGSFFSKEFCFFFFTQNFFPIGILFGIPAGFFEEIGWTGYAFPKMVLHQNKIKASIILGLLWGCWHLPVIDFLGSATPHGQYLPAFFLAFIALLTAMRVIIAWVYSNTGSVLLAQIMHAISTGSLVMFGPAKILPAQEALWYAVYAVILWITVLIILLITNKKRDRSG